MGDFVPSSSEAEEDRHYSMTRAELGGAKASLSPHSEIVGHGTLFLLFWIFRICAIHRAPVRSQRRNCESTPVRVSVRPPSRFLGSAPSRGRGAGSIRKIMRGVCCCNVRNYGVSTRVLSVKRGWQMVPVIRWIPRSSARSRHHAARPLECAILTGGGVDVKRRRRTKLVTFL